MSEDIKAIARRYFEADIAGNLDILDGLVADNYVLHQPPSQSNFSGRESLKQVLSGPGNLAIFPDMHQTVDDMIAEGDKVAVSFTMVGTHKGEIGDIPPTGKRVSLSGIAIVRIADGVVAEEWMGLDQAPLFAQIGYKLVPEPKQD